MMADALRAIRILPAFHAAIKVHLVETSPALRDIQRAALHDIQNVQWHDRIDDVPAGPSIILANEYFDALPVHQAVKKITGWHERVIENSDSGFTFGIAKDPSPRFEVLLPPQVRAAPHGAIFEWRSDTEVMSIARRVRDQGGAALIIDYGHIRSDAGDTFQAVANHNFANPLKDPGLVDITSHVDFQALGQAAETMGARVHGPIEQGIFLNKLGIETRALALMKNAPPKTAETIASALTRLTGSGKGGMGTLFKVLGVSHPDIRILAALSESITETERT
jgi:NADH dehydrogenase [ubiquinone] 1 alpha subcomplex assembly factor 7